MGREGGEVEERVEGASSCPMDHLSSETAGLYLLLTGPQCGGPREDRTRRQTHFDTLDYVHGRKSRT